MTDLQNFVKKALYLGIGAASYAGEQASQTLNSVQEQAQSLAEDMIRRGEMTADDARQWLDSLNTTPMTSDPSAEPPQPHAAAAPRTIEVEIMDDAEPEQAPPANDLHQQVDALQDELRRLQNP